MLDKFYHGFKYLDKIMSPPYSTINYPNLQDDPDHLTFNVPAGTSIEASVCISPPDAV